MSTSYYAKDGNIRSLGSFRYWRKGRHCRVAVLALLGGYVLSWLWWDVGFDTHLLGQYESVPVLARHVLPMVSGIVSLAMMAPSMPNSDILGTRSSHDRTARAMVAVSMVASLMTPIVRAVFCMVPLRWIPRAVELYGPDTHLADLMSWDLYPLMWMPCGFVFAIAMISIVALGRLVGTMMGLASYLMLLIAASWKPVAMLSPLSWNSADYTNGRMIVVSCIFVSACLMQWLHLRHGCWHLP